MPAYVVVQLSPRRSRKERAGAIPKEIDGVLARHGARATPSGDDASSLVVEVASFDKASVLAAALRETEGVESAYAKPGDELP